MAITVARVQGMNRSELGQNLIKEINRIHDKFTGTQFVAEIDHIEPLTVDPHGTDGLFSIEYSIADRSLVRVLD